jgi:hypothetical protein
VKAELDMHHELKKIIFKKPPERKSILRDVFTLWHTGNEQTDFLAKTGTLLIQLRSRCFSPLIRTDFP